MTELETWYRKLVSTGWADNTEVRFIIKSRVFIEMPKTAKSAIYWKDGNYYMVAMNHSLKWANNYVNKFPDMELFINKRWYSTASMKKNRGRPRKNCAEPLICRNSTAEQIKKSIDNKRLSAILNYINNIVPADIGTH